VTPTANAPVATHALTVDSMSGSLRTPLSAPAAIAPPVRRTGWIAALAVAVVVVGAIVFYLVKQPEPAKPAGFEAGPVASVGDAMAPLDALPERPVAADTVDAAVALKNPAPVDGGVVAAPADAAAVEIKPKPPKPPSGGAKKPAGDFDDGTGDPALVEKLRAAERAFEGKQWTVARDLVNQVIDSPLATPRQLSRAHALHGAYECRVKNNQGGAKTDLRSIKMARWRAWLIEYCDELGYPLR
ncbi:MAG: hypothetical protein H0T89_14560, partial [Deltaproteobacteria bacterium]|nr:hypothetical protein [Deltaproteobacteria bacterium]MDQ3301548.1 hypothetical protein [Myxococcota bacterium]